MLWASKIYPQISVHDSLEDTFDFNKTPPAPAGCKIVAHEKSTKQKTYDPPRILGWYVGPALEHYRCYTCSFPKLLEFKNCDTVDFFPHQKQFTSETL